jgi:hypothetical protein
VGWPLKTLPLETAKSYISSLNSFHVEISTRPTICVLTVFRVVTPYGLNCREIPTILRNILSRAVF